MSNPKTLKSWKRASKSEPAQSLYRQAVKVNGKTVMFFGTRADASYLEWLASTRAIPVQDALDYCNAMDRRTLISETHEPDETAEKPAERWRLKSKWWKPQSLRSPAMTHRQLMNQARLYREWLKERDGRRDTEMPLAA